MFNFQMLRQKAKVTRQRRNSNQILNVQTRKLSLIDKEETLAKWQMFREKSDRRTDRPANTRQNIDKVRPANAMQLSTKFNEIIV